MTAQTDTQEYTHHLESRPLPEAPDFPAQSTIPTPNGYSHQLRTLLAWSAPGRPFRKRNREYYLTSLLIMLFIEIILFLFSQYLLMMVVASLVFMSFALSTVPPHNFHYKISTEGLTIEDHFFLWQELYDFYFKKRHGMEILHIRTHALLPGELTITLGSVNAEHIRSILINYLPYREVIVPTFMDKSADWLSRTFPLEHPTKKPAH